MIAALCLIICMVDRGLIDFAFIVEPPNLEKYNYIEIPGADIWGLAIRKDDALAEKRRSFLRICLEET